MYEETSVNKDKPIQPDLFGSDQKRRQTIQTIVNKNKADKEAGVKPVPKPLFADLESVVDTVENSRSR